MEDLKKKVSKSHWNHVHKVCVTQIHDVTRFLTLFLLKMPQFLLKTVISVSLKNPHFCLFPGVLHGKLKFQDKFYNIIDHNKWPSSEKQDEKCIFRKSCFHQIQPKYDTLPVWCVSTAGRGMSACRAPPPRSARPGRGSGQCRSARSGR